MQVFKCAMRIIRGNIIFPIIYIVGLSFMGIFMAASFDFDMNENGLERYSCNFSVIDRDDSELSDAIASQLAQHGTQVVVEDTPLAIQDAVAKGATDYLLIIPEGYETDFVEAAHADEDAPSMETVFSYYSMEGELVDQSVNGFLGMVRSLAMASPETPTADIIDRAANYSSERAQVAVIEQSTAISKSDRFVFYLQWSTYTLFAGITVCVGLLVTTLGRVDVRRRNLSSPLNFASYNLQLGAACMAVTLLAWAWTFCLGLVAFPDAAGQIEPGGLALCALSMLAYCTVPLALGFLLGQVGANGIVCNATGNIVGMVISFFGGAWISLDLMTPEIVTLAHLLPGYWYSSACSAAAHAPAIMDSATLELVLGHVGVLLLFALALLCVSLVAGRKRLQTSEAGGNRAAEASSFV